MNSIGVMQVMMNRCNWCIKRDVWRSTGHVNQSEIWSAKQKKNRVTFCFTVLLEASGVHQVVFASAPQISAYTHKNHRANIQKRLATLNGAKRENHNCELGQLTAGASPASMYPQHVRCIRTGARWSLNRMVITPGTPLYRSKAFFFLLKTLTPPPFWLQ